MISELSTLNAQFRRREAGGFTLIEMLIAMVIGLVVVLAVGYVFVGSRQTYRSQDAAARLQEGARYAYEVLSNDIRMAGITGCNTSGTQNIVDSDDDATPNPGNDWYKNLFGATQIGNPLVNISAQPIYGYEGVVPADVCTTANTASCYSQGDGLTVLRADTSQEYIVQSHASPTFTLTAAHDIHAGEIMVVTNCTDATALFQTTGTASTTLNHDASGTPGNFTDTLTGSYGAGSRIYRLHSVTYYIGQNPAGEPALYRRRLTYSGNDPATVAEELVEGVENMQITYGVDTDATADKQANSYQTATEIENASGTPAVPGATAAARWQRVLSVRVSLLMRSAENGITTKAQTYTYPPDAATTTTATDRRLRRAFTFVVSLRNRI